MGLDPNDYNKGGFFAFLFCMVACGVFFIYLCFFHPGVHLDNPKIKAEVSVTTAQAAGPQGTPKDMSNNPTPWISSPEFIEYGLSKYKANCAVCHGDKGLGDGPAGVSLNPKPRNLVEGKWKAGGSSKELFLTVTNGLKGTMMASFQHLPVVDRWAIVHYIRSISKNAKPDNMKELEKFAKSAK